MIVCVLSQFNGSIRCGISIKDITEARLRCWSAEVETVNLAAWMHTLTQFWRWRHGDSVCSSVNEMRSSNKLQELNILQSKSYLQNNSTLQSVARRIIFWTFCGENMLTSSIYSAGISLHLLLWKLTDAVVLYKITNLKTIYAANILSRHNIWFRGHLSLVSDSCIWWPFLGKFKH